MKTAEWPENESSDPRDALLKMPSTLNQNITFGGLENADKESASKDVEGKTGSGDNEQNDSGDAVDGTMSSNNVDPMRVEVAMLAVSPSPPMNCQKCSCALIQLKHRHGRIKSKARNVRTMQKLENACQEHSNVMQSTLHHQEGIGTCQKPVQCQSKHVETTQRARRSRGAPGSI